MARFHPLLETGDKILLESGTDTLLLESDYANEVLKDGAILYWRLGDAVAATTMRDTAGSRPGIAIGAPTFGVTGALVDEADTAMSGDGSNYAFLLSPGSPFWVSTTGAISLEIWALLTSANNDLAHINQQYVLSASGSSAPATNLSALLYNSSSSIVGTISTTTNQAYAIGVYRHFVLVMTASVFSLYVDGTLAGSVVPGAGVGDGSSSDLEVGLAHTVDEFAIYNVVLTPAQIVNHYEIGSGKFHRKLFQVPQLVAQ